MYFYITKYVYIYIFICNVSGSMPLNLPTASGLDFTKFNMSSIAKVIVLENNTLPTNLKKFLVDKGMF